MAFVRCGEMSLLGVSVLETPLYYCVKLSDNRKETPGEQHQSGKNFLELRNNLYDQIEFDVMAIFYLSIRMFFYRYIRKCLETVSVTNLHVGILNLRIIIS